MKSSNSIFLLTILLTIHTIGKTQDYTDKLNKVDKYLSLKYNEKLPGCAIGIVKDGQLIYSKGFGLSNMSYDIPWSSESVINIMSVSKQFTAACIALLVLENKISLNDDIRKYVPELPDYGHTITVDNLIRHTSGIRDYADLVTIRGSSAENLAYRSDALKLIIRQKELNFTPGDKYSYSNSGYLLLTYIVERVSNMTFPDFAQKRIFEPLQMDNSFFSDDPHRIVKNEVISYGMNKDGSYFNYHFNDNRMGCAGLFSTIEDLYKWDQNFYHGKVGGESFNHLMLSVGKFNDGTENDYAFGNIIDRHEGFREINHSGGLLGIRCKISRFPTESFSIIYLGNSSQIQNQDVYAIASLFLMNKEMPEVENVNSSSTPTTAIQLDLTEIEDKTGLYYIEDRKITFRIFTTEANELNYEIIGSNSGGKLFPLSKADFILSNGNILKFLSNENKIFELVSKTGTKNIGRRIDIVEKKNIVFYTGQYYSDELKLTLDIVSVDESIVFKCGDQIVESPIKKDDNTVTFFEPQLGQVTIEFRESTDGKIEFLFLTTGRTNKLKFKRV